MTVTPPRVLTLDLSLTATGIAHPNGALGTIRPAGRGDDRLVEIRHHIDDALSAGQPHLVALEDLPIARNPAAGALGMLHGVIRALLIDHHTPYLLVPPATLKVYAAGRGNAPKPDMRMELYKRAGLDIPDDNEVDAAWLRLLGLDLLGHPELDLPQTHRRALQKLTLPGLPGAA